MSERHPIDELFHHALHDAEVTPPPSVWEGIVRERTKRRGGYWGWSVLTLVLVGGASALWFSSRTTPTLSTAKQEEVPATHTTSSSILDDASGTARTNTGSTTPTTMDGAREDRTPNTEPHTPTSPAGATRDARTAGTAPAPPHASQGSPEDLMNSAGSSTIPDPGSTTLAGSAALSAAPRANEENLDRLSMLAITVPMLPVVRDSVRTAARPAPYVLPNADWWVALEVGRFDEHRMWYGTDEQLVTALNATEVPHYTWSAGVLGGRTWRNGFGFSLGTAYEGSSQSFHFTGPATVQDSVWYFPYLVTLDTQVFVSHVDSLPFYSTVQEQTNATNRFSAIRVSGEGYWHTVLRRWTFGPRLGLGVEFTTMRQGYTVDSRTDSAEVSLVSVPLEADEYDARYATLLTGMVGADIGFALNEHWGLWATPTYSRGLTTWGSGDAPYMLPDRLGLRLRLSYTFTKIP